MTRLRAQAVAAFEEDGKRRKALARAHFKKDFGVDPDEVGYLGDHHFLFRSGDLYIRGYIEGERNGGRCYRLAASCPRCEGLIVHEGIFYGLAGLGEAIKEHRDLPACDICAIALAG